jgi:hypothetical protein
MVITTTLCYERQSCGNHTLKDLLSRWTLQSVWHWSSSQELWKLNQITILGWMPLPTSQLPENSRSKIGMILMLSRSPKGTWCDYCKNRHGTSSLLGQMQAVWQITSKRYGKLIVRHYCQSCANEVQAWPDGTTWTLKEQIDYAKGETLDV